MIFYLFIDGIGYGENNIEKNPFTKFANGFFLPLGGRPLPELSKLQKGVYLQTDASMGIKGLPQSATGQTALWTGISAPKIVKRHISGFPTFTLKKIISQYSIVKVFLEHGKKASFLNCYSPTYMQTLDKNKKYLSASTLVQLAANLPLKDMDDLRNGRGLFMDITHEIFREFSNAFLDDDDELRNIRNPYEMGKKIKQMGKDSDLILFEYFLTDKVGHSMEWDKAKWTIGIVEQFIEGVLDSLDIESDQLIVTSDHGNLEDLSDKVHTTNPVPTFLYGKHTHFLQDKIQSLSDIVPALYEAVGIPCRPFFDTIQTED
jgi:hypothetical protein